MLGVRCCTTVSMCLKPPDSQLFADCAYISQGRSLKEDKHERFNYNRETLRLHLAFPTLRPNARTSSAAVDAGECLPKNRITAVRFLAKQVARSALPATW